MSDKTIILKHISSQASAWASVETDPSLKDSPEDIMKGT